MPDPGAHPESARIRSIARHALLFGVAITAVKFGIFGLTNSAAVLSDALESIVNLAAAAMLMYSLWLSSQPADRDHPYGHGKVEFMSVGVEGTLILTAGLVIAVEGARRLFFPPRLDLDALGYGMWLLGGAAVATGLLGAYIWRAGRQLHSAPLVADGQHLMTDLFTSIGSTAGLALVRWTGQAWIDPIIALTMALLILLAGRRLLFQGIDGLMDRSDPADDRAIKAILDEEVRTGSIRGYHKLRHRHSGRFHWVDMHIEVDPAISVQEAHAVASRIEHRIEQHLGQAEADATAHLEPAGVEYPWRGRDRA